MSGRREEMNQRRWSRESWREESGGRGIGRKEEWEEEERKKKRK